MVHEAKVMIIRERKQMYITKLKLALIFHGWLSFCLYILNVLLTAEYQN